MTHDPVPRRSVSTTTFLPIASVLCGAAAGLLGIGGGMIIGPLLLELGLENQAVAATGGAPPFSARCLSAGRYGHIASPCSE